MGVAQIQLGLLWESHIVISSGTPHTIPQNKTKTKKLFGSVPRPSCLVPAVRARSVPVRFGSVPVPPCACQQFGSRAAFCVGTVSATGAGLAPPSRCVALVVPRLTPASEHRHPSSYTHPHTSRACHSQARAGFSSQHRQARVWAAFGTLSATGISDWPRYTLTNRMQRESCACSS